MMLPLAVAVGLTLCRCGASVQKPDQIDDVGRPDYGSALKVIVEEAGQWYSDTISGALLSSDIAGDTLIVAELEDVASPPVAGKQFFVESRAKGNVRIASPRNNDEQLLLYAWGPFSGAGTGRSDSLRWVGIAPENADGDTVAFDIPVPNAKNLYRRTVSAWSGFSRFSLSVVKNGSPEATTLANFQTLAARAIIKLLDSLPDALEPAASERVRSTHRYSLTISSSSYYKGSWHILGFLKPRCLVALSENATESSVAHEMGHYFSHILAGDERYATLESLAPDGDHGLGVVLAGRSSITEEYAYFTEYFMTGAVNSAADPLYVQVFLGKQVQPATVDMPSVEGFGTVLMAMLQRSDTTIIDFEKRKDTLPILSVSFGELYGVLATGPKNINELRAGLASLCSKHSFDTGWQICAERAGWSYHGKGKVVDSDGKAVVGAEVFNALMVDKKLKRSSATVRSNGEGVFELPRLYPGKSHLYAVVGTDTATTEVDISWDGITSTAVTLPNIKRSNLKISSVAPDKGYEGDTITVKGSGFGATRGSSKVLFGTRSAVNYPFWSDTLIKVSVPRGARPNPISVMVTTLTSNTEPFTVLSSLVISLRKATVLSVRWRGTHEFMTPSGSANTIEAFSINTDEIGSATPTVAWANDSFKVSFDGEDVMKKKIVFTLRGKVNAWGDTIQGVAASWTSKGDTCEENGIIPTYSFSYHLSDIQLNDHNTTFNYVHYRIAGETIATHVSSPSMTNVACNGTTSYVSTLWDQGVGTTDIDIYFEWGTE